LPSRTESIEAFIRRNLPLRPVPGLPGIVLHTAYPGSGLRRLPGALAPYWAWPWAGGLVLARHFRDHPSCVRGRRILDLGAGSGLVGIAAMLAGAGSVLAAEVDGNGLVALSLNATANGVILTPCAGDALGLPVPDVDLVVGGDVYYDAELAPRVTGFLERCRAAGIEVLIGDPGRAHLPLERLQHLAGYEVPDFGAAPGDAPRPAAVYRLDRGAVAF
jgi:predicted nicotinamide N-methyase